VSSVSSRLQERLQHLTTEYCFSDADEEWKDWNRLGDPVLHIDLRDWADLLVLMPLSAHSLAKVAHGLADDTLSCVARAWDFGHGDRPGKPVLLAPAMNTAMWQHVLTAQQLATIQGFWNSKRAPYNRIKICPPQVKALACGEVGDGALASVDVIVETIQEIIEEIYLEWRVIENIRATSH
jgi:phosphopantothenoylcysteine decarboxylase